MTADNLLAADDSTSCGTVSHGVWFTYTPSTTTYLGVIETSSQQSVLVYATGCGSTTCLIGEQGPIPVTAGQPVQVLVGSAFEDLDAFAPLEVLFDTVPDECAVAIPVAVGSSESVNMRYATATSGGVPGMCEPATNGSTGLDAWFSVEIAHTAVYRLRGTKSAGPSMKIGVYEGGCPANGGTLIACRKFGAPELGLVQQTLSPGTYLIRFAEDAYPGTEQIATLEVTCAADFNGVNSVTVQDIFDFLTAWLAGNSSADFNGVNGVTVQDIFDFLTAWLAGC